MADILPTLLTFPPDKRPSDRDYDKQATDYVKNLNKLPDLTWTKPVNKQNILDLLDPATNSIPYLYALHAQWASAGQDNARNEECLNRAVVFFSIFDHIQIRYAGERWTSLIELAFTAFERMGLNDFSPLSTAVLRLDPTAGTFTSSHLRLVRLCLAHGVPSQALPILDKNIYAFPQNAHKNAPDELLCEDHELSHAFITPKTGFSLYPLRSENILEYYLLGAHIYIGLRNYARARLFLEYLLLTPTVHNTCSALQMEAYKRWTLLGLLAQGKTFPLPRTHSQAAVKSMRVVSKPYDALADSFEKRAWRKFHAEVDVGAQVWRDDGNARLVHEVADALLRFRVLDLQKTYAALPVTRVASHLSMTPEATQDLLQTMLDQHHLFATLTSTPSDTILHFTPTPQPSSEEGSLEAQTTRIHALITTTRAATRKLQATKEYAEVQKRGKRGAAAGPDGGDPAEQMDLSWDPPIAGEGFDDDDDDADGFGGGMGGDEDIMGS